MKDSATPQHIGTLAALLENAVDYAGLFPPARLTMSAAVQNYAAYKAGDSSWMLGRFIVPVGRLDEFEKETAGILPDERGIPWHLSGLVGSDLRQDLDIVREFNTRHGPDSQRGRAIIDTLELKATAPDEILAQQEFQAAMTRFYEIPIEEDPCHLIAAIAQIGAGAKIRTGGISEDSFPSSRNVIRFLASCVRQGVPYKATAGLHHPLKGLYRLTYDAHSPSGMMFGFLNIFLTGAFLASGMSEEDVEPVLVERSADAFRFDEDGITWRGYRLGPEELRRTRQMNTVSFGSCSFVEPVEELRELGFME
ncbi:MAG: hypothetical protein OEV30_02810 [Ignavibacteria bacterium]|nr:hypothetical protein [Ignavibacteria bacterium]